MKERKSWINRQEYRQWVVLMSLLVVMLISACGPVEGQKTTALPQAAHHMTEMAEVTATPDIRIYPTGELRPWTQVPPTASMTSIATQTVQVDTATPTAEMPTPAMEGLSEDWRGWLEASNLQNKEELSYWGEMLVPLADEYQVPYDIAFGIMQVESNGLNYDPAFDELKRELYPEMPADEKWLIGPCGGAGLFQVLPSDNKVCPELSRASRPTTAELMDPETNMRWGLSMLQEIYENADLGDGDWFRTVILYRYGHVEELEAGEEHGREIFEMIGRGG